MTFEGGFFYLWSEDIEVADDGWNRHDVNEEWSQQVFGEMGSNDWPEKYQSLFKGRPADKNAWRQSKQRFNNRLPPHLNDKVKTAVRVPLERDGLERAKPFVSKIYVKKS